MEIEKEGDTVGDFDGIADGSTDGATVGRRDGISDGNDDGAAVGDLDGITDGATVGHRDGVTDEGYSDNFNGNIVGLVEIGKVDGFVLNTAIPVGSIVGKMILISVGLSLGKEAMV